MTLGATLEERRKMVVVHDDLARLALRLHVGLNPLRDAPIGLPRRKALLSRSGGWCPHDGARLEFRAFLPHEHRCPRCGRSFQGDRHDRAWVWRYHLWLSERAVHAAVLAGLDREEGRTTALAGNILDTYAAGYRSFPNRDNVLGPTRLFFSTYLESIWLIQVIWAAEWLEAGGHRDAFDGRALAMVVAESSSLIAGFDEGFSNRQVWHNAALLAAGRYLDDRALCDRAWEGPHGVMTHLTRAVSDEGWWHEGENYHFFALHGFIHLAERARLDGIDLYGEVADGRLGAMFRAPLATLLPDLTFPARGDSPFGVSVRQPRFAELWEIGRARAPSAEVEALLARIYSGGPTPASVETDDVNAIAEVERHRPGGPVARSDLGWKALMWMAAPAPEDGEWSRDGIRVVPHRAVVMRGGGRYVSVDMGSGSGHGHPDGLHLSMVSEAMRLQDFGTGSYLTPSLYWYRSSAAHNVPHPAGADQAASGATCVMAGGGGRTPWSAAQLVLGGVAGPGTEAGRSVIVGPWYVVDVVDIAGGPEVDLELPIHPLRGIGRPRSSRGGDGVHVPIGGDGAGWELVMARTGGGDEPNEYRTGAGPPTLDLTDGEPLTYVVRRRRGPGRWVQVFAPEGEVASVTATADTVTVTGVHGVDRVTITRGSIAIVPAKGEPFTVRGDVPTGPVPPPTRGPWLPPERWRRPIGTGAPSLDGPEADWPPIAAQLGAEQYRRTEAPFPGNSRFGAGVGLLVTASRVWVRIDVRKRACCFREAGTPDPGLDNDPPATRSDGIQLYVGRGGDPGGAWDGWILVPQAERGTVWVTPVGAGVQPAAPRVQASWRSTRDGYRLLAGVEMPGGIAPGDTFRFNVVVNEMYADRERRAGQLVLVGGGGWAYLRGDREPPAHAVLVEVE